MRQHPTDESQLHFKKSKAVHEAAPSGDWTELGEHFMHAMLF